MNSKPNSIEELLHSIEAEYGKARGAGLSTEQEIRDHCRFFFEGQVFLSHTANDHEFCKQNIIPVLAPFGLSSYFFMSIGIGDPAIATAYRFMVEFSLFYSKTIIFAVSQASVRSDWVKLEAKWTVDQNHPRIICLLDQTSPQELHSDLGHNRRRSFTSPPERILPFCEDIPGAQAELNRLLHTPAFAHVRRPQ